MIINSLMVKIKSKTKKYFKSNNQKLDDINKN